MSTQDNIQQLVAFHLANEEYGVAITQVQEIVRVPEITHIPGMPTFIEGVINLRGKVIPVIDLRKRFSLEQKEYAEKTRIVVADAGGQIIGLVVDSVSEVAQLSQDQIDVIPPSMTSVDSQYLSGVGKMGKRLVILLDLTKLLGDLERVTLEQIVKKEK